MPIFLLSCTPHEPSVNFEPKGLMYYDYFDTISYVYNYAGDTDKVMIEKCNAVCDILSMYNKLFDIYHEYEGVNNLYTINKGAGNNTPVEVAPELITFLKYCKEIYTKTNGKTNVMLGSVLSIWHTYREDAIYKQVYAVPDRDDLEEANLHTSIDLLVIDEENSTVYISDEKASIDVGAIGKGYATEMAGKYLDSIESYGYVLNIGGNIRICGTKPDGTGWNTGIRHPRSTTEYAARVELKDIACVTSGDYERYYFCDGVRYHHICDPDTLEAARYFTGITIITRDSGLADSLSTALFCMSYEDGLEVLKNFDEEIDVLWVKEDGTILMTNGFENLVVK